jgi:hypothetical protein
MQLAQGNENKKKLDCYGSFSTFGSILHLGATETEARYKKNRMRKKKTISRCLYM